MFDGQGNATQPGGAITSDDPAKRLADTLNNGMLTGANIIFRIINLLFTLAVATYAFGLTASVLPLQHSFVIWYYWWICGPLFNILLLPLNEYFLHVEQKSSMLRNLSLGWGRAGANLIYFFYLIVLGLFAAWTCTCMIFMAVNALPPNCVSSPLCSGPFLTGNPYYSVIMLQTAGWFMFAAILVMFMLALYVHAGSGSMFTYNVYYSVTQRFQGINGAMGSGDESGTSALLGSDVRGSGDSTEVYVIAIAPKQQESPAGASTLRYRGGGGDNRWAPLGAGIGYSSTNPVPATGEVRPPASTRVYL